MRTGDIWLAQLDPTVGSEIQKTRPCVVISPDEMNAHLRTVTVAPMTTGSRPAAFRIPLTFQGKSGLIVLDQIRTLDRARLVKRMGALRPQTLETTLLTLQAMFAPEGRDASARLSLLGGTEPAVKAAPRRRPT